MTAVLDKHLVCELGDFAVEHDQRSTRRDVAIVCTLTAIAGVTRLATAAFPPLWNDEAHTFRRVCGSFAELSAMLREEAFPPLHYYLYWLLGRALGGAQHLTPFWMRFIPALAGTLMVPAMWRLARQLSGRRTALLTAAFATSSAHLFAYSHDAKMYMPLWLLVTLNVSWWISWFRGGGTKHWAAWVITGSAIVGYHATGIVILIVELATYCIFGRIRSIRTLAATLGVALITVGPAVYYLWCNDLVSRTGEVGWHAASGLSWIPAYDGGRMSRLATSYLFAWESSADRVHEEPHASPGVWLRATFIATACVLLVAVAAGVWSWMRELHTLSPDRLAPRASFNTFVLCFWLFAPVYAAYRLSEPSISPPSGVLIPAATLCFMTAGAIAIASAWRPLRRWILYRRASAVFVDVVGALLLVAMIGWIGGYVVVLVARPAAAPTSVWVPRYLGFVWPAFAILTCAALAHLRPAPIRWAAALALIGVNVAQSTALVLADSEPPIGRIASDVCTAARSAGVVRAYVRDDVPSSPAAAGGALGNSVGRYYLSIETGNRLGPRGFTESALGDFAEVRLWSAPDQISAELSVAPLPSRVIVWDYAPESVSTLPGNVPGTAWQLVSDQWFRVRNHWNWTTLYSYRRSEYVRSLR